MSIPGQEAVLRFLDNEQRLDDFVNSSSSYIDKFGNTVQSLPSLSLVIAAMTLTISFLGNWSTSHSYVKNDVIKQNNINYICLLAHTSGTFATDLSANKWTTYKNVLLSDLYNNFNIVSSTNGSNGYDAIFGQLTRSGSASSARIALFDNVDVSLAGYHGIGDYATVYASNSTPGGFSSFDALPTLSSSNSMLHYNGIQLRPQIYGNGNFTEYISGLWHQPSIFGNSLIAQCAGVWCLNPSISGGSGVITNNYGIKIDAQTAGTNNWALYCSGGKSYHAGAFGIGATNYTPSHALDINWNNGSNIYDALISVTDTQPRAIGIGGRIKFGSTWKADGTTNDDLGFIGVAKVTNTDDYTFDLVMGCRNNGGSNEEKARILGSDGSLRLAFNGGIYINNTKVLAPRETGWAAWTGSGSKATKLVSSATTAECAAAIKSIIDALMIHGILGT